MEDLKKTPPHWATRLLSWYCKPELLEDLQGDLNEYFERSIKAKGIKKAKLIYVFDVLKFFRLYTVRKPEFVNLLINFIMMGSYLKAAKRRLLLYKSNTLINVLGLVIGIASTLVILSMIRYELSFDKFHSDADRIYRVVRVSGPDLFLSDRSECRTGISYPVPTALKSEIPSLENITSMQYFGGVQVEVPAKDQTLPIRFSEAGVLIDPSFFKILDFKKTNFKWISGNPEKSLSEPFTVVLTKRLANKYFPEGNAMDKILRLDRKFDARVTGVIEDLPTNSDFPFTLLLSYESVKSLGAPFDDWFSVNDDHQTYVKLATGTTREDIEKQIAKVHAAHTPKDIHDSRHYLLQPLSDIHYDARFGNYSGRTISRQTILILGLVAVFLLLTACINYINLATAQSTLRSKEVGLRKVMGSNTSGLILQLMTETFLVVLLAGLIALGSAELLLPRLQSLLNIRLDTFLITDPFILASLILIILAVTLFSGFYPSLVTSRFSPATALKNRFATEAIGGISLRKILVVAQFTITQIFVIATFIVVSQMNFFRNVDMGFNKDAIVNLPIPIRNEPAKIKEIEGKLNQQAFVAGISFSSTLPSGAKRDNNYSDIGRKEANKREDYQIYEYQDIDPSYLDLYQIKLVAGRKLIAGDTSGNILINKTLAKNLLFKTSEEAIGNVLKMDGHLVTVVGIVDDFYSNSLKSGVDNILMVIDPKRYSTISIKMNLQGDQVSVEDKMKQVEKIWSSVFPEYIFEYQFFDENIKAFYLQEEKYAQLFQLFSLVFLLIGCLGLYGLITFVVNRKSKEVAIRKVLGASLANILAMFSKEYVQLIGLSFLIAVPVSYYGVNNWLSNFASHIELEWWLFFVPGVVVMLVAMLVIISKSFKAVNENPIDKLKYE
ncbi:MAG: ABC transporter permease [Cyclobacteriaceae bacterium]